MISLLKPVPPSTETGAFMLYSTWLLPAPVRTSVSAAVEKPLVVIGSRQAVGRAEIVVQPPGRMMLPALLSVWAEREAAHDEEVVAAVALEVHGRLVAVDDEGVVAGAALGDSSGASLVPRDSQPRVVAIVATSNTFSAARLPVPLKTSPASAAGSSVAGTWSAVLPVRAGSPQAVQLAGFLELVVARAAVEVGRGGVVVDGEVVVAAERWMMQDAAVHRVCRS